MHPSGSNPASSSPSQPMRFTSMFLRAAVALARVHPRVAEDRLELARGVDAGAVERRAPRLVLGVLQVRRDGAGAVKHADDLRLPVVRGRATEVEHARVGIVLALRVSVGARDVADVGHGEDHGARARGARARGSPGEVRGRTTTSRFPGKSRSRCLARVLSREWQQSLLGVSFAIKSTLPACSHSHSHLQKMMTEYLIYLTQHPPPAGSGPTRFPGRLHAPLAPPRARHTRPRDVFPRRARWLPLASARWVRRWRSWR